MIKKRLIIHYFQKKNLKNAYNTSRLKINFLIFENLEIFLIKKKPLS